MSGIKTPLENYVIRALKVFMVGKGVDEYQRAIRLILDGVVDIDEYEIGKKGCPDILLCKDGCFIGLEVKTAKGRQSKAQVEAQKRIEACGGKYYVVRSIDNVRAIIESEVE